MYIISTGSVSWNRWNIRTFFFWQRLFVRTLHHWFHSEWSFRQVRQFTEACANLYQCLTRMSLNSGQRITFLLWEKKIKWRDTFVSGQIVSCHICILAFTVALLHGKSVCMEPLSVEMPEKLSTMGVILSLFQSQLPKRIYPFRVHRMEYTATLPKGHRLFHIVVKWQPLSL